EVGADAGGAAVPGRAGPRLGLHARPADRPPQPGVLSDHPAGLPAGPRPPLRKPENTRADHGGNHERSAADRGAASSPARGRPPADRGAGVAALAGAGRRAAPAATAGAVTGTLGLAAACWAIAVWRMHRMDMGTATRLGPFGRGVQRLSRCWRIGLSVRLGKRPG